MGSPAYVLRGRSKDAGEGNQQDTSMVWPLIWWRAVVLCVFCSVRRLETQGVGRKLMPRIDSLKHGSSEQVEQ